MSLSLLHVLCLLFPVLSWAVAGTYTVPASAPAGATLLEAAPLGISFEFFTFPAYFTDVTGTMQCLQNFESLTGTWPPIRIGGTTQDRATYDPSSSAYVTYTVASSVDAPASLTFGPSFFSLAASYAGSVVLGLNRALNNISNTIQAAVDAKKVMKNLIAVELGNEPEFWGGEPIAAAAGAWNAAIDAESQDNWDIEVGQELGPNIIQTGNNYDGPPGWGAAELIATQNATSQSYMYSYGRHNYPGGTLTGLMDHSNIVQNVASFQTDANTARGIGKTYVFGETNSVSGGGAATVSPTYGAALWTMDYTVQAALGLIPRSYFHHGTLGACYYCWWGRYDMGAPYFGAYVATAFMAGASTISELDDGTTGYAAYVVYDAAGAPLRALLYNSDYYAGSGTRPSQTFVLGGLGSLSTVQSKRLTSASSTSRIDQGAAVTFGGQYFANGTCVMQGTETFERLPVTGGQATFTLQASEALLVNLQCNC